jgi:DUF4097 and DUF4098 domain-containing protein YvlB
VSKATVFAACLCVYLSATTHLAAAADGSFVRTLKVTGSLNLEVSTGSGDIHVTTGNSSEVLVTGRIRITRWLDGDAEEKVKRIESNPPIQQNGNEIRIGQIDDPDLYRNISIRYELVVPADTQLCSHTGSGSEEIEGIHGSINASSGSGGLKISNINDTVRAETGSGSIEIDQIKGNVHAKTGSGSIRATDVAGGFEGSSGSGDLRVEQTAPGSVRVNTGSGSIELRGIRGSLEASSGSGSIHADGDPTGGWNIRTGSGGVELQLPSEASFDLDAHTHSGTISMKGPVLSEVSNGRKDMHGRVRGGGVSVHVETGSGSIEIR